MPLFRDACRHIPIYHTSSNSLQKSLTHFKNQEYGLEWFHCTRGNYSSCSAAERIKFRRVHLCCSPVMLSCSWRRPYLEVSADIQVAARFDRSNIANTCVSFVLRYGNNCVHLWREGKGQRDHYDENKRHLCCSDSSLGRYTLTHIDIDLYRNRNQRTAPMF